MITFEWDFDEEVLAYYISFLKALSLKLNTDTLNFFFNNAANDFPLYTEAVKFFNHPEPMIGIAVRTLTLNIYRLPNEDMRRFILDRSSVPYFSNLVHFIASQCTALDELAAGSSPSRLDGFVDAFLDYLFYVHDIFDLGIDKLNAVLGEHIMTLLVHPLLLASIARGDSPDPTAQDESTGPQRISPAVALFVLAQLFHLFTWPALVNDIVRALLLPPPSTAASSKSATRESLLFFLSAQRGDHLVLPTLLLLAALYRNRAVEPGLLVAAGMASARTVRSQSIVASLIRGVNGSPDSSRGGRDGDGDGGDDDDDDNASFVTANTALTAATAGNANTTAGNVSTSAATPSAADSPAHRRTRSTTPALMPTDWDPLDAHAGGGRGSSSTERRPHAASDEYASGGGGGGAVARAGAATAASATVAGDSASAADAALPSESAAMCARPTAEEGASGASASAATGSRSATDLPLLVPGAGGLDETSRSEYADFTDDSPFSPQGATSAAGGAGGARAPASALASRVWLARSTGSSASVSLSASLAGGRALRDDSFDRSGGGGEDGVQYAPDLVARLLLALHHAPRLRPSALQLCVELLCSLVDGAAPGGPCSLSPPHQRLAQIAYVLALERLRRASTGLPRALLCVFFEEEYLAAAAPVRVERVVQDGSVLMPAATSALSGRPVERRLACGEHETARRAMQVALQLRRVRSMLLGREDAGLCWLDSPTAMAVDAIRDDLAESELVAATLLDGPRAVRRFVVLRSQADEAALLLVERAPDAPGCAVVRFAGSLDCLEASVDAANACVLHIQGQPLVRAQRKKRWVLDLAFDTPTNALSALQQLHEATRIALDARLEAIALMLGLPRRAFSEQAAPVHG